MADKLSKKTTTLYKFDDEFEGTLIGVDEAGRGPLAGPVVAAAVILDRSKPIYGVNDSKKLTAANRDELFQVIKKDSLAWGIGLSSAEEIDHVNILQATFLAMARALNCIEVEYNQILVDGNRVIPHIDPQKQIAVVKGDSKSASIAAASILAKVTRDRIMDEYDDEFPQYGFCINKGYGTEAHRKIILSEGICEIHRRSFCQNLLYFQTSLPL